MEQLAPEQEFDESPEAAEARRMEDVFQSLALQLARDRDDYVNARWQLRMDHQWQEDLDMYNGVDPYNSRAADMMTTVEAGGLPVGGKGAKTDAKPTRSKVFINLTRNKANAGESRLCDVLLPTDDRNWGIKNTPRPDLAKPLKDERAVPSGSEQQVAGLLARGQAVQIPAAGPDGAPLQVKDIAAAVVKAAQESAKAMQTLIDDQLTECDYNGEQRKLIHWAAVLGTGVMKGPIAANQYRRAWVPGPDGVWVMKHQQVTSPVSKAIDPRNCYPDPAAGENPKNGSGHFERADMTEREVRALAKQPGYLQHRVADVLREGPKPSRIYRALNEMQDVIQSRGVYERWEYWGMVKIAQLRACGCEGLPEPKEGEDTSNEEELTELMACIVMVNDTPVMAYLHPQEGGEIPYDYFVWERVADRPWGQGVPRMMNSQQRVINAAWRMMMDNAGLSVGPQIIVNREFVEPADGQWEITGRKIWWAKGDVIDVQKAFFVFNIDTRLNDMKVIVEMAQNLIDEDTGLPRLVAGERGNAPETVGGMQMLLNSTNVVLRRQVKNYDDSLTRPHITRYYAFNMEHSDDPSVKGDMQVDARGSGALVVRDIQNQFMAQVLIAYPTNPLLQAAVKARGMLKKVFQSNYVDTEEVLYSDEEIDQRLEAQAQQQPKDPRVQVAEINAQANVKRADMVARSEASEIALRHEIAEDNQAYNIEKLRVERELAILKLASQQNISIDQIKASLASTAIKARTDKELFVAESALKLNPANPTNEGI